MKFGRGEKLAKCYEFRLDSKIIEIVPYFPYLGSYFHYVAQVFPGTLRIESERAYNPYTVSRTHTGCRWRYGFVRASRRFVTFVHSYRKHNLSELRRHTSALLGAKP